MALIDTWATSLATCESGPNDKASTDVDTKIASEHAVLAFHTSGRLPCTIIRPSDAYGPGSRLWVMLPLEMIAKGRFLLPAQGQGLFSPVYIDDLVQGIALAAPPSGCRLRDLARNHKSLSLNIKFSRGHVPIMEPYLSAH